jgi:hypothetical protein
VVEQVDARGNVYSMVIDYDSFLEQEGVNPEGATLHDGQKYEDWLKDKEGR